MILLPLTLPLTSLQKFEAVYGTTLHHDDGTQLDGGFTDDKLWQASWREIIALPPQHYDVLAGRAGCIFIDALVEELEGVEGRQWNTERCIAFQAVILQRTMEARCAWDIHQHVERRIVERRKGRY